MRGQSPPKALPQHVSLAFAQPGEGQGLGWRRHVSSVGRRPVRFVEFLEPKRQKGVHEFVGGPLKVAVVHPLLQRAYDGCAAAREIR